MLNITRTTSLNINFIELVKMLDAYLAVCDGNEHAFYAQYNKLNMLNHVVVAYDNNLAVGCGAIKRYDESRAEVKRMFTLPAYRGQGIAVKILAELEKWAAELGYKSCILETGKKQSEALALYKKCDYTVIKNYGQYAGVDYSVCFEKKISG